MPAVFVIRHAEDTQQGPHDLNKIGQRHAALYIMLFNNYVLNSSHSLGINKSQACVCPIGKIISISNTGLGASPPNPNPNPSPNPFKTVEPLSANLGFSTTIHNGANQYWSTFQWDADAKKSLFEYKGNSAQFSVVIAWDKQGLNPTEEDYNKLLEWLDPTWPKVPYKNFIPLLKYFPGTPLNSGSIVLEPLRTNLWVFSDQNEDGKFKNLRFYKQAFYDKDCKTGGSFEPKETSECVMVQQVSY